MTAHPLEDVEQSFLERAVELASESVRARGGPFGAVVTRGGTIIAEGANRVIAQRDPTAHAEITAMRDAASKLATHNLEGCRLYASCEPCPMCFAAALWARLDVVAFAATRQDAAQAGFDDQVMYEEVCQPRERLGTRLVRVALDDGLRPFQEWIADPDRVPY